jgi:phytoene dehydrogenase-like protein
MAAKLTGMSLPAEAVGSVCLYFAGNVQLYPQRKILLNANANAFVNNAVLLTNIAPTYAPPRQHLLSATVLDTPASNDQELAQRCLAEIGSWFPEHNLGSWHFLAAYRIPFSQFAQRPGVYNDLPDNHTPLEGLFLAGEYTESSSIHGAMHSGEKAAKEMLRWRCP